LQLNLSLYLLLSEAGLEFFKTEASYILVVLSIGFVMVTIVMMKKRGRRRRRRRKNRKSNYKKDNHDQKKEANKLISDQSLIMYAELNRFLVFFID